MICENCKKENRSIARYCKWCGKELTNNDVLSSLVGLDEVKAQLRIIAETYTFLHSRNTIKEVRLSVNTIIIGETGTGKSSLANIIRDFFYQKKIIRKPKLTLVDAVDYQRFVDKWDENIEKAKGGILFFDNVQKLLPDKYSNQVNPLDKLFVEMDRWNDDPIVFISGLTQGLDEFLQSNPAVTNRFKYKFQLPTPTYNDLFLICCSVLENKYGLTQYSQSAKKKLLEYFKYQLKTKDETYGFAHDAVKTAEDVFTAYISRGSLNSEIQPDDIKAYVPKERTLEEILSDLDNFIGMDEVKSTIKEIAYSVKNSMERQQRGLGEASPIDVHIVLTGNPGTGKTTMARKLGEILASIGYLDSGHVVEVDRSQMVSQYQGETPKVVDKLCDKAMGGILFVDEAYTLAPVQASGEKDQLGTQALEKLMKRMEDDRGKFVVIAAGYHTEMENLFRINPGFRSRFSYFVDIKDYTPEELYQILMVFAKLKNYVLTPEASELVKTHIEELYNARDNTFANGRTMRQLFDTICKRQAQRLEKGNVSAMTNEEIMTINVDDIPYDKPKGVDYSECLDKLDGMVGMDKIKTEISNLAAMINLQLKRGDKDQMSAKHYVFTGNPGTGKTTVARIMAEVFKTLGLVSRGQLVEADRSKLVAGFAGQTAIKTNQLIDTALGGVLFIDEAYTLVSGDNDTFGKEAIDTLLKRLEDDRGKFICIVAGYTDNMRDFIAANPGLQSRFTQTIQFDDYNPDQLTEIFMNLAKSKNFVCDDKLNEAVHRMMEQHYLRRDKNFGNARVARKLFEDTMEKQSQRLMSMLGNADFSQDEMYVLKTDDLPQTEDTKARPLDEVLADMERLVGMRSVKDTIRRLAVQSMFMKQRSSMGVGKMSQMVTNFTLTGNPGTGKTTVARMMGQLLQSMDVLPTSRVVEVSRVNLVGKYMGETAKLVDKACDNAMGGVLFIDEAYTLCNENDNYGKEAIETLMKRMEDDRGKFAVIIAGYKDRIDELLETNPGLASRFTQHLHIDDYKGDELLEIFRRMAEKENYKLSPEAEVILNRLITSIIINKNSSFGNAREIRNIFNGAVGRLSERVMSMPPEEVTKDTLQVFMPEDIKL